MIVDPLFAQWLQSDADHVVRTEATAAARWGATGVTSERDTGIATKADAVVEGDRQLAFFARGPFGLDVHTFIGTDWADTLGQVVTIVGDQLGYGASVNVFVIGAELNRETGTSVVTVLAPLRDLA